jgi:hypothetical protein
VLFLAWLSFLAAFFMLGLFLDPEEENMFPVASGNGVGNVHTHFSYGIILSNLKHSYKLKTIQKKFIKVRKV